MKALKPDQLAFLSRSTFWGNCLLCLGFTFTSAATILWSAIPGETVSLFTRVGFEVWKRSRTLSPRVGSVTI